MPKPRSKYTKAKKMGVASDKARDKASSQLRLPIKYFNVALERLGLSEEFIRLLGLYGLTTVDDLKLITPEILDDLEQHVNKNTLGSKDFTSEQTQMYYLGEKIRFRRNEDVEQGSNGVSLIANYHIAPFTRIKLLNRLPCVVAEIEKEISDVETFRRQLLDQNVAQDCSTSGSLSGSTSLNSSFGRQPFTSRFACESDSQLSQISSLASSSQSTSTYTEMYKEMFMPSQSNNYQDLSQDDNYKNVSSTPRLGAKRKLQARSQQTSSEGSTVNIDSDVDAEVFEVCLNKNIRMSTANDADQDSDEASPEASKRSLQEISVSLCQKVNEKLKEFWAMTDFKERLFNLSDLRSVIKNGKVLIKAKCLICEEFYALNVVANRTIAINNYKSHVAHHLQQTVSRGVKKVLSCPPVQQPKINSFFKQFPKPLFAAPATEPSLECFDLDFDITQDKTQDKTQDIVETLVETTGNEVERIWDQDGLSVIELGASRYAYIDKDGLNQSLNESSTKAGPEMEIHKEIVLEASTSDYVPYSGYMDSEILSQLVVEISSEICSNVKDKMDSHGAVPTNATTDLTTEIDLTGADSNLDSNKGWSQNKDQDKDGEVVTFEIKQEILQSVYNNVPTGETSSVKTSVNKSIMKKYKIVVSNAKYREFNTTVSIDNSQTSIISYMDQVTTEGYMLRNLIEENKLLREELNNGSLDPVILKPTFFTKLMQVTAQKRRRKKKIYDDTIMDIALYYFLIGGKRTYETMSQNLPLPSLSVVYRHLYDKKSTCEGVFQFDEFVTRNKDGGDCQYVWLSEDDTKITQGLAYYLHEDTIVGLCSPIDQQKGIPAINPFKFVSVAVLKNLLLEEKAASYAKVMAIKPLKSGAKTFILVAYGTDGSDTAVCAKLRWAYVAKEFMKRGITVVGVSTDGAEGFRKAMQDITSFYDCDEKFECPQEFDGFFDARWDSSELITLNDAIHLVVKMMWRIMCINMMIGDYRASSAIIVDVLNTVGKHEAKIGSSVVTNNKDAMNYGRVEKICTEDVYSLFTEESQKATKIFLKLVTCVNDALIITSFSPEERIKKLWYAVFFCRLWRVSIELRSKQGQTLQGDFLTRNAYACLEINAHNFLKYLVFCRELNKPEMFLPYETNSQPCENFFRNIRSMGSTNYTVINFNMLELLHKIRRAMKICELQETIDPEIHETLTKSKRRKMQQKHLFVPTSLPSNIAIKCCVDLALLEALQDAKELGIHCYKWSSFVNTGDISSYPRLNIRFGPSANDNTEKNNENQDEYNEALDEAEDICGDKVDLRIVRQEPTENEFNEQISEHDMFLADVLRCDFEEDTSCNSLDGSPTPKGFIKLKGRIKFMRKTLILWCLSRSYEKISVDRLRRFIGTGGKLLRKNDNIFICHFIKMFVGEDEYRKEEFVQVLGFRLLKNKHKEINKHSMPIYDKDGKVLVEVGVIGSLYDLKLNEDGELKLKYAKEIREPLSFERFIKHVQADELLHYFG